jgi:hypothetical protein
VNHWRWLFLTAREKLPSITSRETTMIPLKMPRLMSLGIDASQRPFLILGH